MRLLVRLLKWMIGVYDEWITPLTEEEERELFNYLMNDYEDWSTRELARDRLANMSNYEAREELEFYREILKDDGIEDWERNL